MQRLAARLGDLIVVDDEDERLTLGADGASRRRSCPRTARASGGRSPSPGPSSSTTTRPTCSVTSRTPSPRRIPAIAPRGREDAAEARRGTTRPSATRTTSTARTSRARTAAGPRPVAPSEIRADAPRRRRARREPGDPARAVAPVVPRARARRTARGPGSSCMSDPVTGPGWSFGGRSRSTPSMPRRASSRSISGRSGEGPSGSRACGRATPSTCSGRWGGRSRWTRAVAAPAADRRRPGHGRRPDAGRRGAARRAPGGAAVRGGVGAGGLPVEPAAGRGRVRRRDR